MVDERIDRLVIDIVRNQKLLSRNQDALIKKTKKLEKTQMEMSEALDVLAEEYLNKNIAKKGDVMVA